MIFVEGLVGSFADVTLGLLESRAGRVLDDPGASEHRRDMAIEAVTAIAEERARIDTVTLRAAAVLEQLRRASAELVDAMNEKVSIAQIKQLGGDIKTLGAAARVVAGS